MKFWTRKAPESQVYCSHYLKDKAMMEELGVSNCSNIEYEINNGDFSLLIDTLGEYEDFMRKHKFKSIQAIEQHLKQSKSKKMQ